MGKRSRSELQARPTAGGVSRREFLATGGVGGLALLATGFPLAPTLGCSSGLNAGQRMTLRSLWDAVIPGVWEGVVEDELSPGVPAPGADDANVNAWLEGVADTLPWPLDWISTGFLRAWADDLDLWSDTFHGWPLDGAPKFWELDLGPSIFELGRQHKIILMQALFFTEIDVKYQAGISLAKVGFYSDLWFEANDPGTRVGRAYIGFPLPPGTTPYTDFTYDQVLGDPDPRLITVGPGNLVALP